MTCELCGKEKAVVRIRQIIGNESKEMHLCETCARERGIIGNEGGVGEGVAWLLQGLFEKIPSKVAHSAVCPVCGTRFRDVRESGRVGCSQCYMTFTKELRRHFKGEGSAKTHKGKLPNRVLTYKLFFIDRENLKINLKTALENEDYEKAAVLRDKIRQIDKISGTEA